MSKRYCKKCEAYVDFAEGERGCFWYMFHIFMLVITGLFWAPIWFIIAKMIPVKRNCVECGRLV